MFPRSCIRRKESPSGSSVEPERLTASYNEQVSRPIPPFNPAIVEGVSEVLGDTDRGLTGREIGSMLALCRVPDIDSTNTKRIRLYHALLDKQYESRSGKCVVAFIVSTMAPSRYRNDPASRTWRQDNLNEVLVHDGLGVNDEGKVFRLKDGKAATLNEAARRVNTIRTELRRRNTHPDVLRYCTDEILLKNNFHAVLEAAKSIPDRIRVLTSLTHDGAGLVQASLTNASGPRITINVGQSQTDRSEQAGFANLVIGLLGLYRNPIAHVPKITRTITDDELYEAFATFSMVHRRLDGARHRGQP